MPARLLTERSRRFAVPCENNWYYRDDVYNWRANIPYVRRRRTASERKKWIHCFENVTTILFLVAISEYDQLLFEDETVNRMQEALTLFDSICNSRWFINTSIILFLNKIDRFRDKLPVSPMKHYFPDYEGGDNETAACDYILNRFVSLNQSDTKNIYTHFTCATDTTQIRFVMAAVNDIIIQENLKRCGLI